MLVPTVQSLTVEVPAEYLSAYEGRMRAVQELQAEIMDISPTLSPSGSATALPADARFALSDKLSRAFLVRGAPAATFRRLVAFPPDLTLVIHTYTIRAGLARGWRKGATDLRPDKVKWHSHMHVSSLVFSL